MLFVNSDLAVYLFNSILIEPNRLQNQPHFTLTSHLHLLLHSLSHRKPPYMAVDAHNLNNNIFLPRNHERDMLMNDMEGNINMMMFNNNNRHIAAATVESNLLPVYAFSPPVLSVKNQASMKDDSGLTYAIPSMLQRKRGRDCSDSTINQQSFAPAATYQKIESFNHSRSVNNNFNNQLNGVGLYSFLGEDVSVQILQQQLDIDRFIYQHVSYKSSACFRNRFLPFY